MKAVRLIAAEDEFDTTLGFILKGTPAFEGLSADRTGLLIAHDLLEHQNGVAAMGPVWDELEALGAIWYVRGRWGDMLTDNPSYYSPEQNLASDVTRMFMQWDCEDMGETGPGGLTVGSRPHDEDDAFHEIVAIARRDIPREHNDVGNGSPGEDENGWSPALRESLETYLTLALHRMRTGYRKAQRRFERRGGGQFNGMNLFVAVRDEVKRAAPWIDYAGQEFVLSYGNGEAACRPVYDAEEY